MWKGAHPNLRALSRLAVGAFVVVLMVQAGPVWASDSTFAYQIDRFEVDGNTFGPFDGTADFVDEFDNGVLVPWTNVGVVTFGTVSESGGYAHLVNPGTHYGGLDRSTLLLNLLQDGAGDFRATARFAMALPATDQLITLAVSQSINESVNIAVANVGPTAQAAFGLPDAGYILVQFYGNSVGDTLVDVQEISPADITGDILFRLEFNDTSNQITSAVSLDGGTTFQAPFPLPRFFNFGSTATFDITAAQVLPPLCSTPIVGCRAAGKSLLLMKDKPADDGKDKLLWKWLNGPTTNQSEFGDPTNSAAYSLCVYEGTGATLLAEIHIPGNTGGWSEITGKGYVYKVPSGAFAGVQKIVLEGSAENKARVLVKGKGSRLPDPPLGSVALPVNVQLVNSDTNVCFEAVYNSGDVIKNEPDQFKAKAQ